MSLKPLFIEYIKQEFPEYNTQNFQFDTAPEELFKTCWYFLSIIKKQPKMIRGLPYSDEFEEELDNALLEFAFNDNQNWDKLTAGAWRVLIERVVQSCALIATKGKSYDIISLPPDCSEEQEIKARTLLQIHQMSYFFPIQEYRPENLELPDTIQKKFLH